MKKGFTLIELLAVIVILAIIAIIAVPIILNIIDESETSANKISVDMYKKAVEDAIALYTLSFPEDNNIKVYKLYKSYNGERDFIEYDGPDIDCDIQIYSTGEVYITNCTVDGTEVLAKDSTKENKKYYSVGKETIEAHIGEYVNYVATGTSYTGKWRILGVENKKVLLLSDPIGTLNLQGKDAYLNGIVQMDSMCSPLGNGTKAINARSINAEDLNKLLGYNPYKDGDGKVVFAGTGKEYGNTITYSYKDGSIHYVTSNGLSGTLTKYTSYEDFDGTIISSEYPNNTKTHTSSYYFYDIRTLKNQNVTSGEEIGAPLNSKLYKMISGKPEYWLASRDICTNESRTSWQIRFVTTEHINAVPVYHSFDDDDQTIYSKAVRAVVTLDESANLVYDKENNIWNIE